MFGPLGLFHRDLRMNTVLAQISPRERLVHEERIFNLEIPMLLDRPIVTSRLQKDWYYVTQQFFVWLRWHHVWVSYQFKNRNFPRIRLAGRIDLGRLREEVQHVQTLLYTQEEITWLREKFHEGQVDGFLTDEFLAWLQTSRLSEVEIHTVTTPQGDQLVIEPSGLWCEAMDWETFILPIVTRLHGLKVIKEAGVTEEQILAEAMFRLGMKIPVIRAHPSILIGSFGLRRQFSYELSEMIDERLIREIPTQLVGISNVWMARRLGWPVVGTFAHQLPMLYAAMAIARDEDDEGVRASHMQFFDDWAATFTPRWLTAVSDTFGSDSFFQDFGAKRATHWGKYKQDSGNPFTYAERLEHWLREMGVDPRDKILNPTDGLDLPKMVALDHMTRGRFKATVDGWGTGLSNDTGLHTCGSFVVKPHRVTIPEGRHGYAVKLSDNLEKASGDPTTVERMKRVHGYTVTDRTDCVV